MFQPTPFNEVSCTDEDGGYFPYAAVLKRNIINVSFRKLESFPQLDYGDFATVEDVAKLHSDLFKNYNRAIHPVYQQDQSVRVRVSLFLLMIHDLDMKNQVLTTSGWLNLNWQDEFLHWNSSQYGGVEEITVTQSTVWLPDLLLENTAQNFAELGGDSILVNIRSSGHITWEPGILTKTICEVNIGKYPFDYQKCEIKFLTWMHTNKTLDVQPDVEFVNLNATIANGEWDIIAAVSRPYFYPSTYSAGTAHTGVRFIIELMRKRTFYVLNTIIPVMMLSLLNVLVFLLPASSGEKMALAVTVLLSFTVYLSIISEVMPKTSESISILAVYLTTLLSLSTLSVLSSGVVMNLFHHETNKPVPDFLKCLLYCRLQEIRRQIHNRTPPKQCPSCSHESQHEHSSFHRHENETSTDNGHQYSNGNFSRQRYPTYEYTFLAPKTDRTRSHNRAQNDKTMKARSENKRLYDELSRVKSKILKLSPDVDTDSEEWRLITWKDVGSAVDTVLFWVFLGFTVASTIIALIMFSAH